MTKAEIVNKISSNLGLEKNEVLATVENFMEEVRNSLSEGENVYLRGFGSFIVKSRAEKIITKFMPSGKKRKRHKVATHKRKKRSRANRHKKK